MRTGHLAALVALLAILLAAGIVWEDAGTGGDGADALSAAGSAELVVGLRAGATAADLDGATVVADLPALGMALVRDADERALAGDPAVAFVSTDTSLTPTTTDGGDTRRLDRSAADEIGAPELWRDGLTGAGQTIALIDTGVSTHPDLEGRVTHGPNLAGDDTTDDRFGHGTVMAGLIAGDGTASDGRWTGVAPDAGILSVKVAGPDGASDVSQVLAAMQWLVSCHVANAGGACDTTHDAGVLVLAYATDSTQSATVDPVAYAIQRVHDAGIVVIASAGNNGDGSRRTITGPGTAPAAYTVGAYDPDEDRTATFTALGPTVDGLNKPDAIATGVDVVAPVDTASTIASEAPGALRDGGYIRGSGTSQAAALAGGLAALARQAHPTFDGAEIRAVLDAATTAVKSSSLRRLVAGELPSSNAGRDAPALRGNGMGDLNGSRGSVRVFSRFDDDTVVVDGNYTVLGQTWDAEAWAGSTWDGSTWDGSTWDGSTWDGSTWDGSTWDGSTWDATRWG